MTSNNNVSDPRPTDIVVLHTDLQQNSNEQISSELSTPKTVPLPIPEPPMLKTSQTQTTPNLSSFTDRKVDLLTENSHLKLKLKL